MDQNQNMSDAIDRFLHGKMSPQERVAFEQKIKEDPDLAAEVEETSILLESILYAKEKDRLLDKIRRVESELEGEGFFTNLPAATIKPKTFWQQLSTVNTMAIAAVVGLLLVALYFFRPVSGIHDVAFNSFFQPVPHELSMVLDRLDGIGFATPDKLREDALKQALLPFADGKYLAAGKALETFLVTYPNDPIAREYRAISLLAQDDAPGAVVLLKPLAEDNSFVYQESAQWYLALSYLRLEDPAHTLQACTLLKYLAGKTSGDYQQEATRLLQMLS